MARHCRAHRGAARPGGRARGQALRRFAAVDDLSFTVARGSFFSILGPSGCGKTTLLRMIAGFLSPTPATSASAAKPMNGVPPNRRPVNMVFQHLALFPMMTSARTWATAWRAAACRAPTSHAAWARCWSASACPAPKHKRVDQLSGGQKQRVAIARSLVLEPTLLLLDEPLGALDLKLREHMKIELKQLQAAFGTTFVYITHDQSEALVLSDHVAVMNHGRFEQLGTPQALYYEPQTPFVAGFVGANNRVAGPGHCRRAGRQVELASADGLVLHARARGRGGARATQSKPSCGPKSPAWRAAPPNCRRRPAALPRHGRRACCSTAPTRPCCCARQQAQRRIPHRAAADRPVRRPARRRDRGVRLRPRSAPCALRRRAP